MDTPLGPTTPQSNQDAWIMTQETPGTSPNLPKLPLKLLFFGGAGVFLVIVLISVVISIQNATSLVSRAVDKQSDQLTQILEEETSSFAAIGQVPQVQAGYENPFEEETSYSNPFSEYQNPFDDVEP